MLMGTIPIAARVGGMPKMIKGTPVEDYLFAPGNVDESVDKVEMFLSQSRGNIMDVGMKLREHAFELFNKEEIENKIVNLFKSILSQSNAK
jgi:glycosyltransferase involved in cell wall biosynthesis